MPEKAALQTVVFALNAGIFSLLLAEKIKFPGLIFYLVLGIVLGPFFFNIVQPQSLGPLLPAIIELGVALIMFEGAMHLNFSQYKAASKAIRNLVTVGLSISVISLMLLTKWLFVWPWGICFLFGVLMSVTGPTVIAPILRKIPLKQPIGTILHWESILLEPIVVVGAVLILEFLIHTEITLTDSLTRLLKISVIGALLGGFSGYIFSFFIKRYPPKNEGFRNVLVVGMGLFIFELSNLVISDSGLVAVVVAGFILGNSPIPAIYEIKQFKETITRVIISFLFILLSANLDWNMLIDVTTPVVFLLIMAIFIIRPSMVFLSQARSGLTINAKIFLSLTAPRGIVAASMASLLTILFIKQGSAKAYQFEILAYQVIFVTVFIQSLWSKPLAMLLKVNEEEKRGFLIVGAHPLAIGIAQWLGKNGLDVLLVDRDSYDVYLARKQGLSAHKGDALSEYFIEELPLQGVGNLLALTSNDEVNTLACQLGKRYFGKDKTFQTHKSLREKDEGFLKTAGGKLVFPGLPTLLNTLEEIRKGRFVFEDYQGKPDDNVIPLFQKSPNGFPQPVHTETDFNDNSRLFVLRKISTRNTDSHSK